ncbi:MAG: protoporphyrinogen oxidase [Mycobacterium sp.]|nr:protoporphyrinogen oxidase [Mycobacterium sp.]
MTTSVLLTYHSQEGQTAKIGDRIASVLRNEGATVTIASTDDDPSPAGFDGVILGDSIHLGRHSRSLRRWITHHADVLDATPTALFQVSLTSAHDDPQHDNEAHQLLGRLLDATGLDPDLVGLFAGALAYTRYGWLKRKLMTRIAADQGDDTDTTRDHEYTDWAAVEDFAIDALAHFRAPSSDNPA